MATRHFLLTHDGRIEEYSESQAASVAAGLSPLPQYADKRLRYVQVAFDEAERHQGELHVYTMGAVIDFDAEGRPANADTPKDDEAVSDFEHDACVQFALRETVYQGHALN